MEFILAHRQRQLTGYAVPVQNIGHGGQAGDVFRALIRQVGFEEILDAPVHGA